MKNLVFLLLMSAIACAQTETEPQTETESDRANYASDASHVVGTYEPASSDHTPEAMAEAGKAFLAALDENQRSQTLHELDSDERREWTNLPARQNAGGLPLGKCTETQVKAFCDLMSSLMSQQGYEKMCRIMLADDQLLRGGRARPGFGTEQFSVVIFGTPSATEPWGFQLDGHHVGVNLSIEAERITMSPSFIGTQPQAFKIADESYRPLAGEVDEAFALVGSLSKVQRMEAIVGGQRGRLRSGPGTDGKVPTPEGVSCETFDGAQQKILLSLIAQWVNDLPAKQAEQRMKQISAELGETRFAWHGPTDEGSDVSYSIQGPSLIIEYACQDLGGVPTEHLHTMYRDPTNEYGGQLKQ